MKKIVLLVGIMGMLGMMACAKKTATETEKVTEASTEIKVGEDGEKQENEAKNSSEKATEAESEAKGKEGGGKEKKDLTVISGTKRLCTEQNRKDRYFRTLPRNRNRYQSRSYLR